MGSSHSYGLITECYGGIRKTVIVIPSEKSKFHIISTGRVYSIFLGNTSSVGTKTVIDAQANKEDLEAVVASIFPEFENEGEKHIVSISKTICYGSGEVSKKCIEYKSVGK